MAARVIWNILWVSKERLFHTPLLLAEVFTTADHQADEKRVENVTASFSTIKLTGKIEYQISDKTDFRLNALVEFREFAGDFPKTFSYANPAAGSPTNVTDALAIDNNADVWEIGGDLSHEFDDLGRLKVLFIANSLDFKGKLWIDRSEDFADSFRYFTLLRDTIQTENIIRSTLNKKINDQHSLEYGVELAINKRDSGIDSGDNLPESHKIKETRYEAFISHNFEISSKLNLQTSFNNEWSEISVDSNFAGVPDTAPIERSFSYPKPRINLRYDLSKTDQLRFNIERTVSQLFLGNFVPNYNSEEQRLELTNPELRPEKRWVLTMPC